MGVIKWFLESFEPWSLVLATVCVSIAAVGLLVGYTQKQKSGPQSDYTSGWWKNREGETLSKAEYTEAFKSISGNPIKQQIRFLIRKKDGNQLLGYLDALSISQSGTMYTFEDQDKLFYVQSSEISEVVVLSVVVKRQD